MTSRDNSYSSRFAIPKKLLNYIDQIEEVRIIASTSGISGDGPLHEVIKACQKRGIKVGFILFPSCHECMEFHGLLGPCVTYNFIEVLSLILGFRAGAPTWGFLGGKTISATELEAMASLWSLLKPFSISESRREELRKAASMRDMLGFPV